MALKGGEMHSAAALGVVGLRVVGLWVVGLWVVGQR
jgi:hypothetical protein